MKSAINTLVTVRESKFGKGVFATQHLPKGTRLFKISGKPVSFEETLKMGKNECYCLQVDQFNYIIPSEPFLYSNHSCEPNCGISGDLWFVTLTSIQAGEELLWDYSTSMLERRWTMPCECGKPSCRGIVRDFDQIPIDIQHKYLSENIVLPYIRQYLNRKDIDFYSNITARPLYAR